MTMQWERIRPPEMIRRYSPNVRMWRCEVEDGQLTAMRTIELADKGTGWLRHLSISHPHRHPTWEEQKSAIRQFCPGLRMIQIMPATEEEYVNAHPHCFHWWEQRDE